MKRTRVSSRRRGGAAWALLGVALALLVTGHPARAAAPDTTGAGADLAAARAVFVANLDAIRHHDRAAYLACYLRSPDLARTGPAGTTLGYEGFARASGTGWPDFFEGRDLHLTRLAPGMVYGTYRYRVRYGAEEEDGISERFFTRTPGGWKIAVTTAFPAPAGTPPAPRAIVGATLVDGRGGPPVPDAVIVMRDGRIEAVGPRARVRVPAGVDTLDARGCWVLPGLVDAHVHFSQTGWADGRPDALDLRALHPYEDAVRRQREHPERVFRADLACGVTAVLDTGGYPWTLAMARAAETDLEAPHVSAAGPPLSTIDFWLNLPGEKQLLYMRDSAAVIQGVRYLKSLGVAGVKIWFIVRPGTDPAAMEPLVRLAGREAHAAGLPLFVHATGIAEARIALRAGADYLVHSVDDHPLDAEFIAMAKRNHIFYCPTLTVRDGYVRLGDAVQEGRAPAIDDPNGAVDPLTRALVAGTVSDARRIGARGRLYRASLMDSAHATMAANLRAIRAAGIPIVMGTDAGNPLTLHGPAVYAEMEAMQHAGLTPMEVIVAATRSGARAMHREREFGTVEKGKDADLLIVGADPTRDVRNLRALRWCVRGGVVRSRDELRAAVAVTR